MIKKGMRLVENINKVSGLKLIQCERDYNK